MRSWESPQGNLLGYLRASWRGSLRSAQQGTRVQSQGELQTWKFQPGWNEPNEAEQKGCRGPVTHRGTITSESRLCKHVTGGRRCTLCAPSRPLAPWPSHVDPSTSTAGLFGGAKTTAHSTKSRVTSATVTQPSISPARSSQTKSRAVLKNLGSTWGIANERVLQEPSKHNGQGWIHASFDGAKSGPQSIHSGTFFLKLLCFNSFYIKVRFSYISLKYLYFKNTYCIYIYVIYTYYNIYIFHLRIPISSFSWKIGRGDSGGPIFPGSTDQVTGLLPIIDGLL